MASTFERTIAGPTFKDSINRASELQKEIIAALESLGMEMRDVFGVRLALEELLINGIKHGNYEIPSGEEEALIPVRNIPPYNERVLSTRFNIDEVEPGSADEVLVQDLASHVASQNDVPNSDDERTFREKKQQRRREADTVATFVVQDEGKGFDPHVVPDCTVDANLEKPSGRGILLMNCFMDAVGFNRTPTGMQVICQIAFIRSRAMVACES